eukprot:1160783-Pelagomonas_calceolata.AAC.2
MDASKLGCKRRLLVQVQPSKLRKSCKVISTDAVIRPHKEKNNYVGSEILPTLIHRPYDLPTTCSSPHLTSYVRRMLSGDNIN